MTALGKGVNARSLKPGREEMACPELACHELVELVEWGWFFLYYKIM